MKQNKVQLMNQALRVGTLCLTFKKLKGEWQAVVPARQDMNGYPVELSKVGLCHWSGTLRRLRFEVASRYHAQVYEDSGVCFVNLRWAMKLPNWSMTQFGALGELANAMKQAGLIKEAA